MQKARIDAMTGLRGFAALLVFYAHLAEKGWSRPDMHFPGEVGVMVFFSLSGFLIAFLYLNKEFSRATVIDYIVARFARIAPAYLFIMLSSFLIYTQIDNHFVYSIAPEHLLRHLFFSGNVSVFWSIAPEVQFYALFMLIWMVFQRYTQRVDVVETVLLMLLFIVLLSYRDIFPGTFVGAKLHYFVLGALAGVVRKKIDPKMQDQISLSILHVFMIGLLIAVECDNVSFPFSFKSDFYTSIPSALLSALFVFSFSFPSLITRLLLENKIMLTCGEWSFSIYLLNMPVIYVFHKLMPQLNDDLITTSLVFAIVFVISGINYQLIEKPGARLIRSFGKRFALASFSNISEEPQRHDLSLGSAAIEKL